jgi:hypothetical protein
MSEAVIKDRGIRPPRRNQPLPLPLAGFILGFCIVTVLCFVMSSDFEDGLFWVSQALHMF